MTHHAPDAPAVPGAFAPFSPAAGPAEPLPRWTLPRMGVFIRTLERTRNVAAAARAAGMSRQAAYKLRNRLADHPFGQTWDSIMAPQAAFRRIVTPHPQPGAGQGDGRLQGVTPGDRW